MQVLRFGSLGCGSWLAALDGSPLSLYGTRRQHAEPGSRGSIREAWRDAA